MRSLVAALANLCAAPFVLCFTYIIFQPLKE
jgi:hypothetical protein